MVAQIHYETEEGPQVYNITVTTREEMERALNHFKDETGLNDNQFTIQLLSTII